MTENQLQRQVKERLREYATSLQEEPMPKLLIVDDDPHLRKLVRTYANLEGYLCQVNFHWRAPL